MGLKTIIYSNIGNAIFLINFSIYLICLISYMIKGIEPLKNEKKEINDKIN